MADSKPVKQEVNGTVILPPLVFPADSICQPKTLQLIYCRALNHFHKKVLQDFCREERCMSPLLRAIFCSNISLFEWFHFYQCSRI
jgi:hypothetical protein